MLDEGIYLGDSLRLLKKVTPESISLVLADPPYNVSRKNNLKTMGRRGIEFSWDRGFDQTGWLSPAITTITPGGAIIVFNDWKNLGDIAKALKLLGMNVKRTLQWYKTNPIPRNKDRVPVQRMEYAVYAVKPGEKWTFNRGAAPTKLRKCCKPYLEVEAKYCGDCGRRIAPKGYEDGIFYHPIQKDALHPTKKPDRLWEDIIKVFTNKGEWVLDPFAGSGTLAIAGTRTGRKHISFDNDWVYVMWARHLWKQAQNKKKQSELT